MTHRKNADEPPPRRASPRPVCVCCVDVDVDVDVDVKVELAGGHVAPGRPEGGRMKKEKP
ncbi:hypothetical protein BH10PSE16_BH10PSE16_07580 [soil metagenome]